MRMQDLLTKTDEQTLRELAAGVAKDIEDLEDLLKRLGLAREDYDILAGTRTFKSMLDQAVAEWQGASNTLKRTRLKAAVSIEHGMPAMHAAMVNEKEPLASRVKVFETMARIAGLGTPEQQAQGPGQAFRLEINLGANKQIIVSNGAGAIPDLGEWSAPILDYDEFKSTPVD